MKKPRRVELCDDVCFRAMFGREDMKAALLGLLNAVLVEADRDPIVDLTIQNPFQLKKWREQKETVLDILVTDVKQTRYNKDLQIQQEATLRKQAEDFAIRSLKDGIANFMQRQYMVDPDLTIARLASSSKEDLAYLNMHTFDFKSYEQFVEKIFELQRK